MSAFASPFPLADPFAHLLWELQAVLQTSVPVVFLWDLLSARLARSAVGDLVVELQEPLPPGELQASLTRTIRRMVRTFTHAQPNQRAQPMRGQAPFHALGGTSRPG